MIDVGFGDLADLIDRSVFRNTDNARQGIRQRPVAIADKFYRLADGILAGPVFLCHGTADQNYGWTWSIVSLHEAATAKNARADDVEKVRTDGVVFDLDGIVDLRMARQHCLYCDAAFGETERSANRIGHAIHPGHGLHPLDNIIAHGASGSCVQASRTWFRVSPMDCWRVLMKAAHERAGGYKQSEGDGNLQPDGSTTHEWRFGFGAGYGA